MVRGVVWKELREHLPFTFFASLVAGVLVVVAFLISEHSVDFVLPLFEVLHPLHVLVSAAATSTIYYKYRKSIVKGIIVGVIGAILIGSLSDVLLPWISGNLFSLHTHFHLPIIEKPFIILGVGIIGALAGIYLGLFKFSHSLHVFLSVFASLFYILAFSIALNTWAIFTISLIVFLAVFIPCCISDIVFPLWLVKR